MTVKPSEFLTDLSSERLFFNKYAKGDCELEVSDWEEVRLEGHVPGGVALLDRSLACCRVSLLEFLQGCCVTCGWGIPPSCPVIRFLRKKK